MYVNVYFRVIVQVKMQKKMHRRAALRNGYTEMFILNLNIFPDMNICND